MGKWIHVKLIINILGPFLYLNSNDAANNKVRQSVNENFKISINLERTSMEENFNAEETAVVIDSWIGRLGNNCFQLLNAYLIAEKRLLI